MHSPPRVETLNHRAFKATLANLQTPSFQSGSDKKNHVHVQLMCQERQREYDTKCALGPGTAKFSSD